MAGADSGFNATEFRDAIRFAMRMGSPTQTLEKATFKWTKIQTFAPQDPAHRPYHWNQDPVTDTTPTDVTLDEVAVEYATNRATSGTEVGTFLPMRATVTVLDQEYAQVEGADLVMLSGNAWSITVVTVVALFSVDVYQIACERL